MRHKYSSWRSILSQVTLTTAWYSKEVKPVIYMLENSHPTNAILMLPVSTQNVYQLRFTYILEAEYEFQVMCYSLNSRTVPHSVMMAVPVKGFGRVFIVPSIPFQPSVQVISGEEDLSVTVEISYTTKDGKQVKSFLTQKDSKGIIYLIRGYNSLSVELCKYKDKNSPVTGAMLKGSTNFGALIGSCIVEPRWNTTDECSPGFDIDMLLPVTEYFKYFIVALPLKLVANVVLSFTGVTEVVVNNERKEDSGSSEMSRDLGVFKGIHIITVSRATYVSVVLHSPCPAGKQRNWKVMFNSILPRSLFIDVYLWETVFYKSHEQYIVVVYKIPNQFFILLDGVSIHRTLGPDKYNETVLQRLYFSSVQIESRPGRHQLYSLNAHKFGAYLYGSETQEQIQLFMTPLGFVSQPAVRWGKFEGGTTEEEKCDAESRGKKVSEGDFIDNDCDFSVDEELKDGIDNDQDGKIDEDITLPFPRNGEWSGWEQWQCESIDGTLKNRSRSCTNPAPTKGGYDCEGPSAQSTTGNCQHVIQGIVDGEMVNVAVECLCDETLGNLSMAKLKRDCIPPPSPQGEPCKGNKELVGPEDTCPKSCLKKEICRFERNSSLATQVTSEYAGRNLYAGLEGCRSACQSEATCQGFTVSIKNPSSPDCWLFYHLIFGKENATYESYIQRCTMVCEPGYFSKEYNTRDYSTCTKCPKGTYKNFTSSGPCLLCPTNWTTPLVGSTSIKDCDIVSCPPGYFLNMDRKCQPCQLGTYKNIQGNEACLPCPADKMTATVSTTDQASCNITLSGNQTKPSKVTELTRTSTRHSTTSNTALNSFTVITLTQKQQYAGTWGGWSKWSCVENCIVKSLIRTRQCLDPPEGPRDFDCLGFSYQLDRSKACNTICATICPNGLWGFNCSKTCPNCETRCEKETGICNRCKPGFRDPLKSCSEACVEMTFGFNCSGNCAKKCQGKDCVERATGTCPSKSIWDNNWWYVVLVLLIIPIIVACSISGRVARHQYEIAEANELMELHQSTETVKREIPMAINEKEVDPSADTKSAVLPVDM